MSEEKKCCGGKCHAAGFAPDVVDGLKSSAESLGFGSGFVQEVLSKWGPQALSLAVEALRQGFSVAFVNDLLEKLGPKVLELVVGVSNSQKMLVNADAQRRAMAGFLPIEGEQVQIGNDGPIMEKAIIMTVLAKWVPDLVRQFGPKLFDQMIDLLKANEDKVIEYVADAVGGMLAAE